MEITFFVEVGALFKMNPETRDIEAGYLEAFDAARSRIYLAARKVYTRAGRGVYFLTAADF